MHSDAGRYPPVTFWLLVFILPSVFVFAASDSRPTAVTEQDRFADLEQQLWASQALVADLQSRLLNSDRQSEQRLLEETIETDYRSLGEEPIESYAYTSLADKSHDDHKYVDAYASLFEPIRGKVKNVLEIGVENGNSMPVWSAFFMNAKIIGLDMILRPEVLEKVAQIPRVKVFKVDCTDAKQVEDLKLGTFDIIIDDGPHRVESQEKFLALFWQYLAPGGTYVIEDVNTSNSKKNIQKGYHFIENPEKLQPFTKKILTDNPAFFINCALGHRNWRGWKKSAKEFHCVDRIHHNSNLIVIRKRRGEVPPFKSGSISSSNSFSNSTLGYGNTAALNLEGQELPKRKTRNMESGRYVTGPP